MQNNQVFFQQKMRHGKIFRIPCLYYTSDFFHYLLTPWLEKKTLIIKTEPKQKKKLINIFLIKIIQNFLFISNKIKSHYFKSAM